MRWSRFERAANGLSNVLSSPIHTYTLSAESVSASVLAHLGKLADAASWRKQSWPSGSQVARSGSPGHPPVPG